MPTRFLCVVATCTAVLAGCATSSSTSQPAHTPRDVRSIAGSWQMDLSPKQDQSYLKELVITPDEARDGESVSTFTGSVYGGSPFDNGLSFIAANSTDHSANSSTLIISFVSDEKGEMGGPYYWLGVMQGDALTGRVRSLTRSFELDWSARRERAPSRASRFTPQPADPPSGSNNPPRGS